VRVSDAGIFTWGEEELVIERVPPRVGSAVCVRSGNRLAFRRVLEVRGRELCLRADLAPFEDRWDGEVLGCVRPRLIDRIVAVDPKRWTRASWMAAVATARLRAAGRRFKRQRTENFTTTMLPTSDWPRVRAFWRASCGKDLPLHAHERQQVVGLFDGERLVGVNIQLLFGTTSYSAFTLVDRGCRGMGGGRKMIDHAVAVARANRLESIYVHINARNLPSLAAYRGAGVRCKGWWSDEADPLVAAERQWLIYELDLGDRA